MPISDARIGELLLELSQVEPPAHDELTERRRRERMSRAMQERLTALDADPRTPARHSRVSNGWKLATAAGFTLIVFAGARWVTGPSAAPVADVEREVVRRSPEPRETRSTASSPMPPEPLAASAPTPARKAPKVTAGATSAPAPAGDASLAAQNELFQLAVRASRRGDDSTALGQLEALLERHPHSVLAADARVRKFRILSRLGRDAEARVAAEQYLAQHPGGFATDEARKLVKLADTEQGEER